MTGERREKERAADDERKRVGFGVYKGVFFLTHYCHGFKPVAFPIFATGLVEPVAIVLCLIPPLN